MSDSDVHETVSGKSSSVLVALRDTLTSDVVETGPPPKKTEGSGQLSTLKLWQARAMT